MEEGRSFTRKPCRRCRSGVARVAGGRTLLDAATFSQLASPGFSTDVERRAGSTSPKDARLPRLNVGQGWPTHTHTHRPPCGPWQARLSLLPAATTCTSATNLPVPPPLPPPPPTPPEISGRAAYLCPTAATTINHSNHHPARPAVTAHADSAVAASKRPLCHHPHRAQFRRSIFFFFFVCLFLFFFLLVRSLPFSLFLPPVEGAPLLGWWFIGGTFIFFLYSFSGFVSLFLDFFLFSFLPFLVSFFALFRLNFSFECRERVLRQRWNEVWDCSDGMDYFFLFVLSPYSFFPLDFRRLDFRGCLD